MANTTVNIPRESTMLEIRDALKGMATSRVQEVNEQILEALDGTPETYKKMMRKWFILNGARSAKPKELTALCDDWYTFTRDSWNGSTTFYQPEVSVVSTGTGNGDNASLTCKPSTDAKAETDDYAGLPLFACVDCNFEIDPDTLEPIITAIDGITDNFARSNPNVYVGVMQMSGYHYWIEEAETYTDGYSAVRNVPYANVAPLPEAVRMDGSVRPWVVHSKYNSRTVNEKMTSCSGVLPTAWISHNTLHTLSSKNGAAYSGSTTADYAFLQLMCHIKYKSLTLDGILQGCCANNFQYEAAVAEEGVKRIILKNEQAANLEVGMGVLLGNYSGNKDRGQSAMYSITGQKGALITAIEDYQDAGTHKAVYVDVQDAFDTVADGADQNGTTYLSTFHWRTGMTDGVKGNDGSPKNCTNGKYPAKLQGIEYMVGGYEVLADVILSLYMDSAEKYWYEPYTVNTKQKQGTAINGDYKAVGVRCEQPATDNWCYIGKMGFNNGVYFPEQTGGKAGSTNGCKDAFYQNGKLTGTREMLAFGSLATGVGLAGLSCLAGFHGLSSAPWTFLARLSANGNRGEWVA